MAALIYVLGLCVCASISAEHSPGSFNLRPSPFGAPHKLGFLEVPTPTKPSKEAAKPSQATPPVKPAAAKPLTAAKNATKAKPSAADDILHPKVEYDPDTAALMAQADDAIKEAEAVDNAPPKPAPKKDDKKSQENLGMINALRGMVCGHKLKKHLSLCDMKEFQGAEIKSEVHQAAIPDAESTSDTDSVASRADDLMAKVDSLQNAVSSSVPDDSKAALLDVVNDASKVSEKHHVTGAEAMALMKTDVTANLPASVRDTILSVMNDAKPKAAAPSAPISSDVTAGLPASVRDTVLAVMKDSKH